MRASSLDDPSPPYLGHDLRLGLSGASLDPFPGSLSVALVFCCSALFPDVIAQFAFPVGFDLGGFLQSDKLQVFLC